MCVKPPEKIPTPDSGRIAAGGGANPDPVATQPPPGCRKPSVLPRLVDPFPTPWHPPHHHHLPAPLPAALSRATLLPPPAEFILMWKFIGESFTEMQCAHVSPSFPVDTLARRRIIVNYRCADIRVTPLWRGSKNRRRKGKKWSQATATN